MEAQQKRSSRYPAGWHKLFPNAQQQRNGRRRRSSPVFLFLSLFSIFCLRETCAAQTWRSALAQSLKTGGAFAENERGQVLFSHREEETFIPASTLKLATAACALKLLGPSYQFKTEFYLLDDGGLGIKGFGDPSLTTEEIEVIAQELSSNLKKNSKLSGLRLDNSFYAKSLGLDGYEDSDNPYDALPTAISANFNTVFVEKTSDGKILSAEEKTPLTSLGRDLAQPLPPGSKKRINLGGVVGYPERLFSELLLHFLRQKGVDIEPKMLRAEIPESATQLFTHHSRKTLLEILPPMFEFSTNFTANQIFLVLGAKEFQAPAQAEKGKKAMEHCLKTAFQIQDAEIYDGAGLSHRNSISPKSLVRLLGKFAPHKDLLRLDKDRFLAKTGTLKGVNTYAGYFQCPNAGTVRFALLVNSTVPFEYKWKLADMLYQGVCNQPKTSTISKTEPLPKKGKKLGSKKVSKKSESKTKKVPSKKGTGAAGKSKKKTTL